MKREVRELLQAMEREGYIADQALATALHLAIALERPILIEGEAGVGKTDVANVLAACLGTNLIRLQCYEGLDASAALYEWNYQKQILRLRMAETDGKAPAELERAIFGREYLLERPLLQAITQRDRSPVLLIDEVDRADEAFEAFLLELLADFQVTIPELGTIRAERIPRVVVTSNRTRELGDALRRRCLYIWLEHPSLEKEIRILAAKVPELPERLAREISGFMHRLRRERLYKTPGVAESLDWARALLELHRDHLDREAVEETLGCLLKDPHDVREIGARQIESLLQAEEPSNV